MVIDERYAANEIVSHSGLGIPSDNVFKAAEIMEKLSPRTEVIGIDEAQFLGDEVVDVCTKLANLGKRFPPEQLTALRSRVDQDAAWASR